MGELDLVLCYAGLQAQVFKGDAMSGGFTSTKAPAKAINELFQQAGVPLPGKSSSRPRRLAL